MEQLYTDEELWLATNPLLEYSRIFASGLKYFCIGHPESKAGAGISLSVTAVRADEPMEMSAFASESWRSMLYANMPLRITLTLIVEHDGAKVGERRIMLGERVTLGEIADEMMKAIEDIEEAHRNEKEAENE